MPSDFLLYGATGFVGRVASHAAVDQGLRPLLAGRDAMALQDVARGLDIEFQAFELDESEALDRALQDVDAVLHCAGPYLYTFKPMVEACLRTGTHYLDLTGEIPVYEAIAARNAEATTRGVMLLPGVGFDVAPTDCLAVHLKQRLPSATHLTLGFHRQGPAGLPPGTQRTAIELIPYGHRVRRSGRLERPRTRLKTQMIDFGNGPVEATRVIWGDVFTAYHSTGIPNIETYMALSAAMRRKLVWSARLKPLFRLAAVRKLLARTVKPGPTPIECAQSWTDVWGQVKDDEGRSAVSRLHGPEAGVVWTVECALAAVRRVLAGDVFPGFQTPATAFGADFVLARGNVKLEDLSGELNLLL
jgi:short subunit dehydrogenase-like uncharacterized protein